VADVQEQWLADAQYRWPKGVSANPAGRFSDRIKRLCGPDGQKLAKA